MTEECFPAPCTCCVCRGKHCLVYHEGHKHKRPIEVAATDWLIQEWKGKVELVDKVTGEIHEQKRNVGRKQ